MSMHTLSERGGNYHVPLRILAAIVLIGLAARVVFAIRLGASLGGDEVEYHALAQGLMRDGSYSVQPDFNSMVYSPTPGLPTAFRPPLLPAVLAGIYYVGGLSAARAHLVLAMVNAASGVLVVLLALRLHMRCVSATAAGLIWAAWPASIAAAASLQTEAVAIPLLLVGLYLLARTCGLHGLASAAGAGLALGLCALARSNLALVVPAAMVWLILPRRRPFHEAVRMALTLGVVASLTVLPWLCRNYFILGSFTLTTQREPLFLGNNAWARGSYNGEFFSPEGGSQGRWLEQRHPGFRTRSELEKSKIYTQEAVSYWRENRGRSLWLLWRKAVLYFAPIQVGEPFWWDVAFGTMLPFFVVGMILTFRHLDLDGLLLLVPVVATLVTSLVVLSMPRYRLPAEPAMLILACQALPDLRNRLGLGQTVVLFVVVVLANGILGLVFHPWR